MTGVTDVLGGQKYLLQDDDLELLQVNLQSGDLNTQMVDLFTQNSQIISAPQQWSQSVVSPPFYTGGANLASEATGRVVNSDQDTLAVEAPTGTYFLLRLMDNAHGWNTAVSLTSRFSPSGDVFTRVVMGDFTGNGYADVLALYGLIGTTSDPWGMRVVSAVDPDDEFEGVTMGPELAGSGSQNVVDLPLPAAVAVGDFNNDGRDEIAILMGDGQTINFYSVDPQSLAITQTGTYKLPDAYALAKNEAMVAGRFRDCGLGTCQTNADLAIVGPLVTSPNEISVIPIEITPQSNGTFTAQVMAQSGSTPFFEFPKPVNGVIGQVMAQAAPMANWPKPTLEQLVIGIPLTGIKTGQPWGEIDIGTFLPSHPDLGQFSWESTTPLTQEHGLLFDVQAGNFDYQNDNGGTYTYNHGFQLATYTAEGHDRAPHVRIYDVNVPAPFPPTPAPSNPPSSWLVAQSDYAPSGDPVNNGFNNQQLGLLIPTDIEGRSLALGAPTVITVPIQVQPDLVLGIPPMHAGWITPNIDLSNWTSEPGCAPNGSSPCLLNLTVLPSYSPGSSRPGFSTSFSFSDGTKTQTKIASTTSWGVSAKEMAAKKWVWGDAATEASIKLTESASYTHEGNVKKAYDHYSEYKTSASANTVLSDYIFFTQKRMNIYYYPVIGQTVDGNPQYVEFSVPDRITYSAIQGNNQWWYQPVHQPGNVLSYPLNVYQLQQGFSETIVPLTADPPTCVGIGTPSNYSTTWSEGNTNGTTKGSANSFSVGTSFTYASKVKVPDIEDSTFKFSISASGYGSFGSLNEEITSLDSSEGVSINEPEFPNPVGNCCGYGWGDLVFGLENTANPSAQQPLNVVTDPDGNPVAEGDATTGPLFVGFLADVLGNKGGDIGSCAPNYVWWTNVYTKPDVALNHPSRWNWNIDTSALSFNPPMVLATPDLLSNNVLSYPYYQMKGFFITEQGEPEPAPNMPEATAGDQLTLTTRVYNYSLVDTTAPVHVRIYGQLYCSSGSSTEPSCVAPSQSQPCAAARLCGNAFEIGETTIAGIPGFKSEQDSLSNYLSNWTTASVPFDTTNYSNDYMVFWVVVWMQNPDGSLAAEMPGKGLMGIPNPSVHQITDVGIEPYSNNVGLYGENHQFFIAPDITPAPGVPQTPGTLQGVNLVTFPQAQLEQKVPIAMTVHAASGAAADRVNIAYYDGDPNNGGSLLDFQTIPEIAAGSSYTRSEPFTPQNCGVHTLYATAWLGDQPQVESNSTINVTADPVALTQSLIAATQSASFTDANLKAGLLQWLSLALNEFQNGRDGDLMLGAYVQDLFNAPGSGIANGQAAPLIGGAGQLLGCGQLGFTLTAFPDTATVHRGQTATFSLAVTPTGQFKGPVSLNCSGAPLIGGCLVSEDSVTLDGVTQERVTLTVVTASGSITAAGIAGGPPRSGFGLLEWLLMLGLPLLSIGLLHRARRKAVIWLCVLLAISIGGVIGCGSESGSGGKTAPPGVYNISVSASSGNMAQKAEVTLTVK